MFLLQAPPSDAPVVDTAEQVYISSLALLKVRLTANFNMCSRLLLVNIFINHICQMFNVTNVSSPLLLLTLFMFCLCKQMLKHGRAGVPMEVMGLMLGEFIDDYTVRVIDVFAMPQSGTVLYLLFWY